jgi:membrane protease YdiL (CAAX protease family)
MTLKPVGITGTIAYFGGAALLMYVATHYGITYAAESYTGEPILLWFAFGGIGVFVPLLIAAFVTLRREAVAFNYRELKERMRFRKMTGRDWLWGLGGLVAIIIGSAVAAEALRAFLGDISMNPPFMEMEPLTPDRYWIFAVWLPYWVLNILGEEVLWRGVLLPRQEVAFGRWAWLLNGAGWLVFHIAFGWILLITLLPLIIILPWIVQKCKNSWLGVFLHAGLNGPGFVMVAFGVV